MSYTHTHVWIIRIDDPGRTWYVGPLGSTSAERTADELEHRAHERGRERRCTIEALWSDDDCLEVGDYPGR